MVKTSKSAFCVRAKAPRSVSTPTSMKNIGMKRP